MPCKEVPELIPAVCCGQKHRSEGLGGSVVKEARLAQSHVKTGPAHLCLSLWLRQADEGIGADRGASTIFQIFHVVLHLADALGAASAGP